MGEIRRKNNWKKVEKRLKIVKKGKLMWVRGVKSGSISCFISCFAKFRKMIFSEFDEFMIYFRWKYRGEVWEFFWSSASFIEFFSSTTFSISTLDLCLKENNNLTAIKYNKVWVCIKSALTGLSKLFYEFRRWNNNL